MLIRLSYLAPQLNHFEIKPGVIITATEAVFSSKPKETEADANQESTAHEPKQAAPVSAVGMSKNPGVSGDDGGAALDLPSRSIVLKHIWDPLELHGASGDTFYEELEADMRSECGKHGAVEHVEVVADGSVVVRFADLNAAIACLKVMNGRWFAGRQIEAQFDQAAPEEPSDADTKMEAFLASLGE